jgi:DNA sulfur modification protein DndB
MPSEHYALTAIRGNQGNYPYYITHCPLRLVPRLFLFDEREVPEWLRRGRSLSNLRIGELVAYLTAQPEDYILSPLIAVIDSPILFEPFTERMPDVGQLQIPLTAQMVIHDGQHRRAALQRILEQKYHPQMINNDTVPIMLFVDPDLQRSPRIFASLNQTKSRPTKSQQILRDQDSPLATLVRQLVDTTPIFQGLTELEKTTISNRSSALFTLNAIYQATQALLGKPKTVTPEQENLALQFWQELGQIIPEWQQAIRREVSAFDLRQNYVHGHGVTLLAIGRAGHALIQTYPEMWKEYLPVLGQVDWSRTNTDVWEGRAMIRGKMSKAQDSIKLTANTIKQLLGLPLTEEEYHLEQNIPS